MLDYHSDFANFEESIMSKTYRKLIWLAGMALLITTSSGCSGGSSSSPSSTVTGVSTPSKVSVVNTN